MTKTIGYEIGDRVLFYGNPTRSRSRTEHVGTVVDVNSRSVYVQTSYKTWRLLPSNVFAKMVWQPLDSPV